MTPEKINARIAQMTAERDQAVATVNALSGAIQDCQFWLAELEKANAVDAPTS